ncbi:hypothetical protein FB451DRAFT_1533798 [Mycena latifolia]|nr:hypothetical protein FB451DRAFT_1533798 [Mycena latifolia]
MATVKTILLTLALLLLRTLCPGRPRAAHSRPRNILRRHQRTTPVKLEDPPVAARRLAVSILACGGPRAYCVCARRGALRRLAAVRVRAASGGIVHTVSMTRLRTLCVPRGPQVCSLPPRANEDARSARSSSGCLHKAGPRFCILPRRLDSSLRASCCADATYAHSASGAAFGRHVPRGRRSPRTCATPAARAAERAGYVASARAASPGVAYIASPSASGEEETSVGGPRAALYGRPCSIPRCVASGVARRVVGASLVRAHRERWRCQHILVSTGEREVTRERHERRPALPHAIRKCMFVPDAFAKQPFLLPVADYHKAPESQRDSYRVFGRLGSTSESLVSPPCLLLPRLLNSGPFFN